ncbi:MAG: hypothetical protein HPY75_12615, partial [Actinobacteria bacterium]|nr:hypothetical protein [Actinomycetota bacterium]
AYDLAGNLKEVKEDGAVAKQYAYDAANQIETGPEGTYAYDGRGNLTAKGDETFSWDGLGRLSSYKKSAGDPELSFSYDPLGRLSERKAGGESLCFRYDGTSLSQAQETDGQGGIIATYAIDPSGTHLAQERQGTLSYLGLSPHTDVTFALSPEGSLTGARAYSPYGELLADDLSSSLSYQEDYQDPASGLIWMGARWYSPTLARFISVDPVKGEMDDLLSLNPYLCCVDDPVNHTDPTGKFHDPDSEDEPTLSWSPSLAPEGITTGEYWDSMADPVKEERAAAKVRAEERENLENFVEQILAGQIFEKERWIEAGLGSTYEIFGDDIALSEMWWGLIAGKRETSVADIVKALNNWCSSILSETNGIAQGNIEALFREYRRLYIGEEEKAINANNAKWSAIVGQLLYLAATHGDPVSAIHNIIDEIRNGTTSGMLDEIQASWDSETIRLRVGQIDNNGKYEYGQISAKFMKDYLGHRLEALGFTIEAGARYYGGMNIGRNIKYTYHFTALRHEDITLDVIEVPPRRKCAINYENYTPEEWNYYMELIHLDLCYKKGNSGI